VFGGFTFAYTAERKAETTRNGDVGRRYTSSPKDELSGIHQWKNKRAKKERKLFINDCLNSDISNGY
jgi:hypothetical protein